MLNLLRYLLLIIFIQAQTSVYAQNNYLRIPKSNQLLSLTTQTQPSILQGLKIDPLKPFHFDFILDGGDSKISKKYLQEEGMRQVAYFLAALTFESKDLWVNLSPFEKNRIIHSDLIKTDLGQGLLIQDFTLKQLAASLTFPEGELGASFWKEIYKKTQQQFGTTNIPVETFNKVWIVPDQAEVYVSNNTAIVTRSHLKVMIESDYLSKKKLQKPAPDTVGMEVTKRILIPIIEKEVNEGSNFIQLRQIVNAAILAEWFKRHLMESMIGKEYINQNKVKGIDTAHPNIKNTIYKEYLKAYKNGVYNLIKEERVGLDTSVVPRKYFSGGLNINLAMLSENGSKDNIPENIQNGQNIFLLSVGVDALPDLPILSLDTSLVSNFIKMMHNPFWLDVQARLESQRSFMSSIDSTLIDELLKKNVSMYHAWENVNYQVSQTTSFYHSRVANNSLLGTPKGGIRWVTVNDLIEDPVFVKLWNKFLELSPSLDEAKLFISKWIDEEAQALAVVMSLKTAGLNIGLGGAKGAVFIGDIKPSGSSYNLVDINLRNHPDLIEKIAREHSRALTLRDLVGIDIDSPAPDKNTTPDILAYYNDEHIRVLTEKGFFDTLDAKIYGELNTSLKAILERRNQEPHSGVVNSKYPFLDEAVSYHQKNRISSSWIGVFTGKSERNGGIVGRTEATGEGVVEVMRQFFNLSGFKDNLSHLSVSIQAFGNVGRYTALAAAREGFIVKVISDYRIALIKEDGWKEKELEHIINILNQSNNKINLYALWKDGLIPAKGISAVTDDQDDVFQAVIGAKVDILIPAFSERVISPETVHLINAKYIFEAANGPVTSQAEKLLFKRGISVIPDSLANGGGVTVSGFEMEQSLGKLWKSHEVLKNEREILRNAVHRTFNELNLEPGITFRSAFDRHALRSLSQSKKDLPKSKLFSKRLSAQDQSQFNGGIDLNMNEFFIKQNNQNTPLFHNQTLLQYSHHFSGLMPTFINLTPIRLQQFLD